jgi:hypothetical protein
VNGVVRSTALSYTVRALPWTSALIPVAAATAIALVLHLADRDASAWILTMVIGTSAAAVALGLDDAADALLGPVPVGRRRRLFVRVALVLPVALGATMLGAGLAGGASMRAGIAPLLALTATALAAVVACRRTRPEVAPTVGAVVALGWSMSPALLPDGVWPNGTLHELAILWDRHPWLVLAVAAVVYAAVERETC